MNSNILTVGAICSACSPEGNRALYEAVVFDMDGTLLNTLDDIARVVNTVLRSEGLPEKSAEEIRMAVGRGVDNLVKSLVPSSGGEDRAFLARRIRKTYLEKGSEKTRPYPGIGKLLSELSSMDIPMAVFTNKPQDSAEAAAEAFFPKTEFMMVRGASAGSPLKPSAESASAVLEALGSVPEKTLMVGDSDVDMDTATNSGMIPVGVSWGYRPPSLLLERGAIHIINEPRELLSILK
ncbi:MAG: HAD-IA family hydrolase [Candidatus Aegiribacteria sp.]|nr:HAD-IA family hydrolase [Candidatus Aegiribacteria sp.]MBD3294142.1 HAD-IA family hydrolase [Candidatus Fermentibacteria bacterium]